MKKTGLFCLLVMLIGVTSGWVFADEQTLTMEIREYVARYVERSDDVLRLTKQLETDEKTLIKAQLTGSSLITVMGAETALGTTRRSLGEAKGQVTVTALQKYFSLRQAERFFQAAQISLEIERERLRIRNLHFKAGMITESEVLQQKNTVLTKEGDLATTGYELAKARAELGRGLGFSAGTMVEVTGELPKLPVKEYNQVEYEQLAAEISSSYYAAREYLVGARKKWDALQEPGLGSPEECRNAERDFLAAEDRFNRAERDFKNQVGDLLRQYASLRKNLEISQNQATLAQKQYETAKIRFNQGELLKVDLDQTELAYRNTRDKVEQARENLYLQQLRVEFEIGGEM